MEEILQAVSVLPENRHGAGTFGVNVNGELLSISRRVYHHGAVIRTKKLTNLQRELIDCILTRHNDGFVRQKHLAYIVKSSHEWVPVFVVQLLGEYVIEIIGVIDDNLKNLDASLLSNPSFLTLTRQRVLSYWDCYYRSIRKDE